LLYEPLQSAANQNLTVKPLLCKLLNIAPTRYLREATKSQALPFAQLAEALAGRERSETY
jgi:hypothetical protein